MAVFDPSKPYQTVVDKEFAAFTAPKTSTPVSKPSAPVFDPNQPYEVVPESKPVAPVAAPQFNPDADFEKIYSLDEVKTKPEKDLDEDRAFHPVEFGLQNQQALQDDPEALQKVLRIYQSRETRGTTLAEKGAALVKGTPKVAKALGRGVVTTAKQLINLSPPALLARAAGAATVPGGLDIESKRVAGEVAEIPASLEAAGAGSGELLRRGGREIKEGTTGLFGGGKSALTPQEWRNRFFMDLAGLEQSQKAGQGNGAVLQALGNDAETLKQSGIELRPETIQELSVVTDPINWIPIGGTVAGVTKIGGRLATRVVAQAVNPEQAAKLANILNQAREVVTVGREAAGKGVQVVGTGVEKTGQVIQKGAEALTGPATLGTILGGDVTKGLGVGAALRVTPKIIEKTGQAIKVGGEVLSGTRPVPGVVQAAGQVAGQGAIGVGEGLLLSLPFQLGARPEEEEQVLGAAGVAGGVRAGIRTAKITGAKAQDVLASQIFKQIEQAEAPPSATYGTDPALDTAHQAASANLALNSQKLLNWTRELFRESGVEVYSLDDKTFESQTGTSNAHGFAINVGEKIAPDGTVTPVLRILLNADTEALPHELFHALEDLDPAGARGLIDSVLKSWTPEQRESFSDIYNTARNDGRPKSAWTTRLTDEAVGQEAAAEVFSRLYLGQDLSGVAPGIKQKAALFLSGILEKLGAPLGKVGAERAPGVSTLGVRPGVEPTRVGQEWISNLLNRIREQGNVLPEEPITSPLAGGEIVPGEISRRPAAQVPLTPTAPVPQPVPRVAPSAPAPTPARNIRVTREQQNDFAARRAEDLGIDRARAASSTPEATQRVNEVSALMEAGNPVLEIDHRGVIAEGTEKAPSGRTVRRAEQEAAYIAEGLGAAPESVRDRHQKTFVPVRWEIVNGKPQLLAMSLDKVIANVSRAVKDIVAAKQEARLPYEVDAATGKLTEAAWENVVSDLQAYTENQANGFRGDGKKLVRPTEDLQQSLPAENPGYNPVVLPEDKTNFLNLIQGLAPALTSREVKGRVPGAVKGAAIARAQGREPQVPSVIRPQDITKQTYKSGERILETNPLRNELAAAGVPVRELIEVTERINAGDILSVKERPDLQFKAPVTDIIRGGFLPKETAKRPEPYEPLRGLAKSYSEVSGVPYKPEGKYVEVNPDLAKRIADFYESAPSNPADPKVEASYRALMRETLDQYNALLDAGYKIEPWTGEGEPYKSSADAIADVRNNKHLYVLPTENNFGSPGAAAAQNLLLTQSGVPGLPTMNDVFRGVHDIFGHAKEGFQFGPRGELNAWRAHSEMYSPEAQGALAAETLAQNSWVNFGRHLRNEYGDVAQKGEPGYVELPNRPFAEQKNLVVPDELIAEAKGKPEGGQFLPKDQPVEKIAEELRGLDVAGLKGKFQEWGTSLTQAAYDVGRSVKSPADVSMLRTLREESSAIAKAAIARGDFDAAMPESARAQFWQEAIEAATGEGGKLDLIRGALKQPEFVPPFPTEKGQALPKETPSPKEGGDSFREAPPQKVKFPKDTIPFEKMKDNVGAAWLFPDGSGKDVESAFYHDDAATEMAEISGLDGTPAEAFQHQTGSMRITVGVSPRAIIDDGGGDLGLSFTRKPTGAQKSVIKSMLGGKTDDGEEFFSSVSVDVQSPDGTVLVGKTFTYPRDAGKINRFLNNPFSKEFTDTPDLKIEKIQGIPTVRGTEKQLEDFFYGTGLSKELESFLDSENDSLYFNRGGYVTVMVTDESGKVLSSGSVREQSLGAMERALQRGEWKERQSPVEDYGELLPKPVPPVPNYFEVPGRQISSMDADMIQARGTPAKFWLNAKTGKILPASQGHVDVAKEILPNPPKEPAELYDAMENAGWIRGVNEGVGGIQLNGPELSRPAKITVEDIAFAAQRPVKLNGESVVDPTVEFLPKKKDRRDKEGRPLTKEGLIDYNKLALETKSQREKERGETDFTKYEVPAEPAPTDEKPVNIGTPKDPLTVYHFGKGEIEVTQPSRMRVGVHQFWGEIPKTFFFVEGSEEAPGSQFAGKTAYKAVIDKSKLYDASAPGDPLDFFRPNRSEADAAVREAGFQGVLVPIKGGKQVVIMYDPVAVKPAGETTSDGTFKPGKFLPEVEQTFKGFEPLTTEQRAKVLTKRKVNRTRELNPEAILPKYAREEDGSLSLTAEGKPRPVVLEYELANTPLAREAAKGKRGADRETAIAEALGKELVGAYRQAKKNKDLLAGSTWYSTARVRLRKLFDDDAKFFAELLGATSARTPVEVNFRFALDAYNRFKSGEYDSILAKYREGKSLWDAGDIGDFIKATKNEDPTRGQFLDWWVDKHDLSPTQSNGKKFGANSRSVLRVLDGSWQSEVKGPKTPNFAGNLTGQTFEATIDVWAARALHRLANKGNEGRWRILPENETGVSDADFYIGQAAYKKAAEKLGIKPDALQAVLWFAEKKHWEDRGWTRGAGAERSDFNTLLAETEKTPEGLFQKKKTQKELELE